MNRETTTMTDSQRHPLQIAKHTIPSSNSPKPVVIFDWNSVQNGIDFSEGDCACPQTLSAEYTDTGPEDYPFKNNALRTISAQTFSVVPPYKALASPGSLTSVVVLNEPAYHLWQLLDRNVLPQEALHWLGMKAEAPESRSALIALLQSGFLTSKVDDRMPFAVEDTLMAWLHITNACNLRCSYCYLHKTNEAMNPAVGFQAIDGIFRAAWHQGYQKIKLKYAGGEPALNFPLILSLHDYAARLAEKHHISLHGVVLSNGILLKEQMVREMQRRGLALMISLDGLGIYHDAQRRFSNGRGSFQQVAQNIEVARQQGLIPNICVTVSGKNAQGLPELIGWILQKELPFRLNFFRQNDLSQNHNLLQHEEERILMGMLDAFKVIEGNLPRRSLLNSLVDRANLSAAHERPCAAGKSYLVIDQDGRVAKCQMEINAPVTTIWAEDPLAAVQVSDNGVQNFNVDEKEGCRECQWKYWCAGGCPRETFRATNRYDIKSPNCNIYKTLYPEVIRLEALRLLKYQHRCILS